MDMRRDACREACEGSLARLGVDYLDMMIFRGPPKDAYGTTIEQAVESMKVGGPEHVLNCLIWSMLLLCFPHLFTQSAIVDVVPCAVLYSDERLAFKGCKCTPESVSMARRRHNLIGNCASCNVCMNGVPQTPSGNAECKGTACREP